MEGPREYLDPAYQRQMEVLQQSRRRLADLATWRKRLELRLAKVRQAEDAVAVAEVEAQLRDVAELEGPALREAQQLEAAFDDFRRD